MVELRDREQVVITPATDSGAGAAAMIILALILVALIGYMIYAFSSNGPSTIIERDTNTTIQQPMAVPAPQPSPVTSSPAPQSDNSSGQPSTEQPGNQ
jgi:hypothetical protein